MDTTPLSYAYARFCVQGPRPQNYFITDTNKHLYTYNVAQYYAMTGSNWCCAILFIISRKFSWKWITLINSMLCNVLRRWRHQEVNLNPTGQWPNISTTWAPPLKLSFVKRRVVHTAECSRPSSSVTTLRCRDKCRSQVKDIDCVHKATGDVEMRVGATVADAQIVEGVPVTTDHYSWHQGDVNSAVGRAKWAGA